jgi:ATP-dependent exoDNAse (exonuclease V) beta subunit
MTDLADAAGRLRALSRHDETLIVEAAAGTGKTAIIAGRLTLMIAAGIQPRSIAAITFTELAASELGARVERYVADLLAGVVPPPLAHALPEGLTPAQRANLEAAGHDLDELTTSTIHGFCQTIILSYAVEADIDPGARIMDAVEEGAAFQQVFSDWLRRRLAGPERANAAVAILSRAEPRRVAQTLRELARFRLAHRDASAPPADFSGRPDNDLRQAVDAFQAWYDSHVSERGTEALLACLQQLAAFYDGSLADEPGVADLWRLSQPPELPCMRKWSRELLRPRLKTAWVRVTDANEGDRLAGELEQRFDAVDRAYRIVSGRIATALVAAFAAELDEVLAEWRRFKRDAALLDFDDLLECARNLVRGHEEVRRALGERYQHVLIDEFQDTDPVQAEIFFRIAASCADADWRRCELRAGALFMVGDPKQAIYRFRGADVATYSVARDAVLRQWPGNLVHITANFRSRPAILEYVNGCFRAPLSAPGQPGYVALDPTLDEADHGLPCAARVSIELPPGPKAEDVRRAEADIVAETCARLIGSISVRGESGEPELLKAGGIALLAPTGTDLWLYERALAERGLPFISQAGRGFFRRQETQDLIALARTLADGRDTLAFGALMRGPLVGLTEETLLDIADALASKPEFQRRTFSLGTDPADVAHAVARRALEILRDLRARTETTTPLAILSEAVERLGVRAVVAARGDERSARAWANVEAFLERARPYGVRGMKAFAADLTRDWKQGAGAIEGRVDADGDAIEIVTIHSAKGLEWPVVIPVNTGTRVRGAEAFVHRMSDNSLHWVIGEVAPPGLLAARADEEESLRRERERLWYVACTRARELLIIPWAENTDQRAWSRVVNLSVNELPEWDIERFERTEPPVRVAGRNDQTREIFAAESARVREVSAPLSWVTPSRADGDRLEIVEIADEGATTLEAAVPQGAGRIRGLVLHKLMEEVLTGELAETRDALRARAGELVRELSVGVVADDVALPGADEMAETALQTFALPDIASLRPKLRAEISVYGMLAERTALAGRVDALATGEEGRVEVALDWKSDVAPSDTVIAEHMAQLRAYLQVTGAPRGVLVYMTSGIMRWLEAGQ